jgi:hypothetical protein
MMYAQMGEMQQTIREMLRRAGRKCYKAEQPSSRCPAAIEEGGLISNL